MELKAIGIGKLLQSRNAMLSLNTVKGFLKQNKCLFYSSLTDAYIDCLVTEEGSKKEFHLEKLFNNSKDVTCKDNSATVLPSFITRLNNCPTENDVNLVSKIELEIKYEKCIPNSKLNLLLLYFIKKGDTNGVKAIQLIIQKNNIKHFKLHSEYKHYLAEALWINGKIEDSLDLFSFAYDNILVRPKVIVMLKCLFPLLISEHSEVLLYKTIHFFEKFSFDKNDYILLAYIWQELFQSDWFSDQQLSVQIIEKNHNLLNLIQFMIPTMAKKLLNQHKIETFYRLLTFTLQNELNQDKLLIRLLFNYYYMQQNLERCSAVVKYTTNYPDSPLTEEQHRRYLSLLLKGKNISHTNIKAKPQYLKFKF